MAESEDEDKKVVEDIEGAQKAVIDMERADKNILRKTVTKMEKQIDDLQNENTLAKQATIKTRERPESKQKKAFDLPEFDPEIDTAGLDELKKMIREAQETIASRD